jgi:hypothetical protein
MIPLTFAERQRQAQLFAYQVWVRKQMGEQYAHYQPKKQETKSETDEAR